MAADRPLFTSSVEHSLDEKGRLVVPARFRERLGTGFVLTIADPDPCLALYPQETWDEQVALIKAAPVKDAGYRKFVRHKFSNTEEVSCDAQGRLLLPAALRAYANIDKDVITIGAMSHVEIWARERYAQVEGDAGERDYTSELGLF